MHTIELQHCEFEHTKLEIDCSHRSTWFLQVETSSGVVIPATFDMDSRCPDEVVRRIRVSVSSYDPTWQGRLLETYDTQDDVFQIAPACWYLKSSHRLYLHVSNSLCLTSTFLNSELLFQ
jgi:hypothetical protein